MSDKKKEKKSVFGFLGGGLLGGSEKAIKGRKQRLDEEMQKALGGNKKVKRKK